MRWYQATHPPLVVNGVAGDETLESLGIAGKAAIFVPAGVARRRARRSPRRCRRRPSAAARPPPGPLRRRRHAHVHLPRPVGHLPAAAADRARLARGEGHRHLRQGHPGRGPRLSGNTPPLTADGVAGPRTLAALDIWSGMTAGSGRNIGSRPVPGRHAGRARVAPHRTGHPGATATAPACTPEQAAIIAAEFANDGADAVTQQWAVYIASREGGCRYEAVNVNVRTKDDSHCTFQLNALSGMFAPHGSLGRRGWTTDSVKTSLQACADAASDLWVFCGRGPWTKPYTCAPPWAGSTVDQPPALLPPPPDTVPPPVVDEPTPDRRTTVPTHRPRRPADAARHHDRPPPPDRRRTGRCADRRSTDNITPCSARVVDASGGPMPPRSHATHNTIWRGARARSNGPHC